MVDVPRDKVTEGITAAKLLMRLCTTDERLRVSLLGNEEKRVIEKLKNNGIVRIVEEGGDNSTAIGLSLLAGGLLFPLNPLLGVTAAAAVYITNREPKVEYVELVRRDVCSEGKVRLD